jgi:hypothetical protein
MEKKVDCQSSKLSKYKGFMFVNTTSAQLNSLKNESYLNFRSKFLFEINFFLTFWCQNLDLKFYFLF